MTDHLEAAMEEAGDAIYEKLFAYGLAGTDAQEAAKAAITAALPDLEKHFAQDPNVRRAIIQELTDESYGELSAAFGDTMPFSSAPGWLSAKLKEMES